MRFIYSYGGLVFVAPSGLEYMVASDGYGIVLVSLQHYANRLKTMGSVSTNEAGMLGSVIREAAIRRYPLARQAMRHVSDFLVGGAVPTADDMDIIKSSLECYRSDMRQYGASPNDPTRAASESNMRAVSEAIEGMYGTA